MSSITMDSFFIFGAKYALIFNILVALVYFFRQVWEKKKHLFIFSVLTSILALLIAKVSGYLYFDPRPFVVGNFTPLIAHAADNGFPSDHMLLAAVIAAVFLFIDKRISLVLWLLALYVGVSRVYVGVHHPIDIIGSTLIALVSAFTIKIFMDKSSLLRHKLE